ncbi:hypothetical protein L1280_002822 [Deinococcus sp. HSC-46F16]|uniref:hypothetical protein n=1 Tax=Deinococcus sp. HSC-46F16 TaxID=2910968 RepID=UPI00209F385A|nr:hypothetical protein [Deinococcus sp. HSC-46F16]MCP2015654.1 hypothetical protein [Deinococcus sp. HSC-46F16]
MPEADEMTRTQKGLWSSLLDFTQDGPRRRRWTNNFIASGDLVGLVLAGVAVYAAYRGIPSQSLWVVITALVVALYTAFTKLVKTGLDLREKAQKKRLEDALAEAKAEATHAASEAAIEAAERVFEHWKGAARMHEDGVEHTHRQLREIMQANPRGRVGAEAVDSYLKCLLAIFDGFYDEHRGTFSANLTVPNADCSRLWLVRIEPGGRGRSNNLPRPLDLSNDQWGASVAFKENKIVYTPDVRREGNPGDHGYLSVINLPVKGRTGEPIAVVNIDSPEADAFGSYDRVWEIWNAYCQPVLASLSLCLSDPRLFQTQRTEPSDR